MLNMYNNKVMGLIIIERYIIGFGFSGLLMSFLI